MMLNLERLMARIEKLLHLSILREQMAKANLSYNMMMTLKRKTKLMSQFPKALRNPKT